MKVRERERERAKRKRESEEERTTIQEGPLPYDGITKMGRGEITIKATVLISPALEHLD